MVKAETGATIEGEPGNIFAVDAVILPPSQIRDLAILLSEQLRDSSPVVLNPIDYLPHITLAMGYMADIQEARKSMDEALAKSGPITVTLESIVRSQKDFEGYYFYHLAVRNDDPIRQLHHYLLDNLPFVEEKNPDAKSYLLEPDGKIVSAVFDYVSAFRTNYSGERFWPHITLGAGPEGKLVTDRLPIQFKVDKINLCQLGNFCTCRKVLV